MAKLLTEKDYIKYNCGTGAFIRPAMVEGRLRWVVERFAGTSLLGEPLSMKDDGFWIVVDDYEDTAQ